MLPMRYIIAFYSLSYIRFLPISSTVFLFYVLVFLVHSTGVGGTVLHGRLVLVWVYTVSLCVDARLCRVSS